MNRFLSDWGICLTPNGPLHKRKRKPSLNPGYVDPGLSHLLKGPVEVDFQLIHKRVASGHRIRPATLKSRVCTERVMATRQVAMYLCRKLTDSAFPAIGESFRRDDSTAINAYNQVTRRAGSDRAFAESFEKMEQKIAIDVVRRSLNRLSRPRV